MNNIYSTVPPDRIPWNRVEPPEMLREIIETGKVKPCRAIELGCGAGNYVMYFAQNGFDVTGIDISESAIRMAKRSASDRDVNCRFIIADVRGDMSGVSGTFDFAYDWEVMHHVFPKDREAYTNNVYGLLDHDGLYLSVCFSEKSPQFGGKGKYRRTPLDTVLYFSSEHEMEALYKPHFEIQELKTVDVAGKFGSHKAIYAFLKKK
jgi:cyclopropane fatty-acyl-phospholipid synthase-like methyltransferase